MTCVFVAIKWPPNWKNNYIQNVYYQIQVNFMKTVQRNYIPEMKISKYIYIYMYYKAKDCGLMINSYTKYNSLIPLNNHNNI